MNDAQRLDVARYCVAQLHDDDFDWTRIVQVGRIFDKLALRYPALIQQALDEVGLNEPHRWRNTHPLERQHGN